MGKDRLAVEVDMLLDKLLLFQEHVGGKEEEKKELDAAFKDDLFLGVKDKLTKTMATVSSRLLYHTTLGWASYRLLCGLTIAFIIFSR